MDKLVDQLIKILADILATYGIFAFLFVACLVAVGFIVWRYGGKITDSVVESMVKISSTNAKFAESIDSIAELIGVLVNQISAMSDELSYLRKHAQKLELVLIEVTKTISLLNKEDNPELKIRLENIEKEIRREN